MFVQDLVRHAALRYGDAPALSDGERTLSFVEFEQRTARLGNALLGLGLRPGDRVASVLPNCIEELLAYVALSRTGLHRVGLNARDTAEDHAFKVEDSGARASITDGLTLPGVEFALSRRRRRPAVADRPRRALRRADGPEGGLPPRVHGRHHRPVQGRAAHPADAAGAGEQLPAGARAGDRSGAT